MTRPRIGITVDNLDNTAASGRYDCGIGYSRAVALADGVPLMLPHEAGAIDDYLSICDGFIFTGGVDPDTTTFGEAMHPDARPMDATRQAFELALLDALNQRDADRPALGVCLGMQLMALHAGGSLHQYLPDMLLAPQLHQKNHRHAVCLSPGNHPLASDARPRDTFVVSSHQQAVKSAGSMRVIARAPDGVIEAIDDPTRHFYVGVQWHPERGSEDDPAGLNFRLIQRLVAACRNARSAP